MADDFRPDEERNPYEPPRARLQPEPPRPPHSEWSRLPRPGKRAWYVPALCWSLALMLLAPAMLIGLIDQEDPMQLLGLTAIAGQIIPVIAILVIMGAMTMRYNWDYELYAWLPSLRQVVAALLLALGATIGIIAINLVISLIAEAINYEMEQHAILEMLRDASTSQRLMLAIISIVLAPIAEELLFRVALFRSLYHWLGRGPAIVVTSLIFGAIHFMPAFILPLALLGLLLQYALLRTRCVWVPMLIHAGFNALMFSLALLSLNVPT